MSRRKINQDYYGHGDEDVTERYHNEPDFSELDPVGDLFDDEFEDDDLDEEE